MEFSATEYKNLQLEIEEKIDSLSREEANLRAGSENQSAKIHQCLEIFVNFHQYYVSGDTSKKQSSIGSIFPEKLNLKIKSIEPRKSFGLSPSFAAISMILKTVKKGKVCFLTAFPLEWR